MGTLRATTYLTNVQVQGVTLGEPTILVWDTTVTPAVLRPQAPGDPATALVFAYDDASFPDGTVALDATGKAVITPDPVTV